MDVKKLAVVWYRIVARRRTARDELLPSKRGRFHHDATAEPTSYAADSLLTAWSEVAAHFGAVPADPKAFRGWRVTLRKVKCKLVDLRDPKEQARYGITGPELLADVASPKCRAVAKKIRDSGFDGIVYKSVRNRPAGVCVALFLEHLGESITIEPVPESEWKQFVAGL